MPPKALQAVSEQKPNRKRIIKNLWSDWIEHASNLIPSILSGSLVTDDELWRAIESSQSLLQAFALVCEALADNGDERGSLALYHGYSELLTLYKGPFPPHNSWREGDFDFFPFLGHAFITTQVSLLIEAEQWEILTAMLAEPISFENYGGERTPIFFDKLERHIEGLENRKKRLGLNRISLHNDALCFLYSQPGLAKVVSFQQLQSGDFFLFLRMLEKQPDWFRRWCPRSCEFLKEFPQFLRRSVSSRYARQLLEPLRMDSIAEYRKRLQHSYQIAIQMFSDDWGRHAFSSVIKPEDIGST